LEEAGSDPYLCLVGIMLNSFSGNLSLGIIISFIVMVVLLFLSAMISGSEVAFFSMDPPQIKEIRSKKSNISKLILAHLDIPKRLLATILITNNFVNVAFVILGAYISGQLFNFADFQILGFILEVIVITIILVLFGEIVPKIYANHNPVVFASFMARPLNILIKIFYPFSSVLVKTTSVVDKKLANANRDISMSELSEAIDITADEDAPEEETKILKGIVKFSDIEVKEIMKSRVDVISIDSETPFDKLIEIVVESGYSRIPAYTETFDNIKGILYVKDLLPHLGKKENFDWLKLLRPAFFVPENKKINDLLQEFQEKKIHLAIVVDEYGGTSGIITLEDIIEEIVGEITDEYDSPDDEPDFKKIDDQNYIFEGKTSINDFCKIVGIEDDSIFDEIKGDSDSLAGVILELEGEIPEKNTKITYKNFDFYIRKVDKRRIQSIQVTIHEVKEDKGEESQ